MSLGNGADTLIASMSDVQRGLKNQLADAQAVFDAKHDACDSSLRELTAGIS